MRAGNMEATKTACTVLYVKQFLHILHLYHKISKLQTLNWEN